MDNNTGTHEGVLEIYFETGTEGVIWSIYKDGFEGYDALVLLDPGDHLTIYAQDGSVVFDGELKPDYEIGWLPYAWSQQPHEKGPFCYEEDPTDCAKGHSLEWAKENGFGQQAALGYWVHWIQSGFEPDSWARYFITPKGKTPFRGKVVKAG